MKCGDKGWKTKAGAPCQQGINPKAKGCLFHTLPKDELRLMGQRGYVKSRLLHDLMPEFQVPAFCDRHAVVGFAHDVAQKVLSTGCDPKRVDTALKAANVALQAFAAQEQQQLLQALLKLEHGGIAAALLMRLKEGVFEGRTRAIPAKRSVEEAEVVR